uniref:CD59 molecule (CD59 blood group) n=1 Tax=Sphaeramia orbicularis TaxID=375764 RepID=A0A672YFI7_9TELE
MKRSLIGLCVVLFSALIGLGSSIRCYSCKDYTASCTKQRDCSYDDACLTLTERGGMTYRQCLKYSDCEYGRLGQMFPQVGSPHLCWFSTFVLVLHICVGSPYLMFLLLVFLWWIIF